MSKKINKIKWQLIFNILIIINLIISIITILLLFRVNEGVNFATWKDTHNNNLTQAQIECIKNPSDGCEEKVKQYQENLDNFIRKTFNKK